MKTLFHRCQPVCRSRCAAAAPAADRFARSRQLEYRAVRRRQCRDAGLVPRSDLPIETADPAGSTVYHDLKFSDAYDQRYTAGAEVDYDVQFAR